MDKRQETEARLNGLWEIRERTQAVRADYSARIDAIMATVQDQIDAVKAEFEPQINSFVGAEALLEAEIKEYVINLGASVKATNLHAVYAKGRVTWDGKKLDGMMSIIPALADARKEGEPSVSIRGVK